MSIHSALTRIHRTYTVELAKELSASLVLIFIVNQILGPNAAPGMFHLLFATKILSCIVAFVAAVGLPGSMWDYYKSRIEVPSTSEKNQLTYYERQWAREQKAQEHYLWLGFAAAFCAFAGYRIVSAM